MPTAEQVTAILTGAVAPKQDFVVFAGVLQTPGYCEVSGDFSNRIDVREPMYMSGGSSTWAGQKLRHASIAVFLWEDSHFAQWQTLCTQVLFKPPGRFALPVQHPVLDQLGLKACIVEHVSALEQDDSGLWTAQIDIVEWRPALPAFSKPVAAIPTVNKPAPTAQDANEVEIQRLINQKDALAAH